MGSRPHQIHRSKGLIIVADLRQRPTLRGVVLPNFCSGSLTCQFWQNEAKMINLFNTEQTQVRCGGADLRLSPCLFTWPDIWTLMRSIDVTTPSPPESIAGLRRAMVNLEYRRHGGGMPA